MGPHDVWEAITRWEFELYIGITGALIVALMWASDDMGKTVLIDLGLVGLLVCSVLGPQRDFTDMTVAGAYTALSTKGVASLLSDTLWRALTSLLHIFWSPSLLQPRCYRFDMSTGPCSGSTPQVIPTQFVLFTISVIVGSAILYRDFESATAERVGKFVGGCALTFLGVYLITSGRAHGGIDEEDDDDDEEGVIGLVDEERYQDNLGADGGESSQARRKSHISISLMMAMRSPYLKSSS
jgi:hypothetical protein